MTNKKIDVPKGFRLCPQCEGTQEECGCGTGKCDHCKDGMIVDYPLDQKRRVPHYLDDVHVSELVAYWNDRTCPNTIGEFLQRVGAAAVANYKLMIGAIPGEEANPTTIGDRVLNEVLVETYANMVNRAHDKRDDLG